MIERVLSFDPYAWFIAYAVVLAVLLVLAVIGDFLRTHTRRSH